MNHALHSCLETAMCIYLLNSHPRVKARVAEVGVPALAVAIPTVGETIASLPGFIMAFEEHVS